MSQRATVRTGDLNRYLKAAKAYGFVVEIEGDRVRLLPSDGGADLPLPDASDESAWSKAMEAWRRSA